MDIPIIALYWVIGLLQVLHSLEETYTQLYLWFAPMSQALHQYFPWVPVISLSADWFAILNILLVSLLLGPWPGIVKNSRLVLTWIWVWAVVELLNGLFHLGAWLYLRHYFPGGWTGPVLLVTSILLLRKLVAPSAQSTPAPRS